MRIVFFGTPEFAVPSLDALAGAGYDVVAAVTQPDRPSGRHGKAEETPVKRRALHYGIPVLQFEKVRRLSAVERLKACGADMFVTAAYGQILSERVLAVPPLGTVNVHASLLPKYRGSAPIQWAVINGEARTGVTTMLTDIGVDTGDILLAREADIFDNETAGELTDRLSRVGAELLVETLRRIERGDCPRSKQNDAMATRCPMLDKSHGVIDWTRGAVSIACQVRGVSPWPGAVTTMPGGQLKVWTAKAASEPTLGARPGTVLVSDAKRGLIVACGAGALELAEIQPPGGKRMDARAYLRGHEIPVGTVFGHDL